MYIFFTRRVTIILFCATLFLTTLAALYIGVLTQGVQGLSLRSVNDYDVFSSGRIVPYGFIIFFVASFTITHFVYNYFTEQAAISQGEGSSILSIVIFFLAAPLLFFFIDRVWNAYFPRPLDGNIDAYAAAITRGEYNGISFSFGHAIYMILLFFLVAFYVLTLFCFTIYLLF